MEIKRFCQLVHNGFAKLLQIMMQEETFLTIEKVQSTGFFSTDRLLQALQSIRLFLFLRHGVHLLKIMVPCKSVL